MYRKDLIALLQNHPMELAQLARVLDERLKDVEDDLQHLRKSLKHADYRLEITPATCRKCGFVFSSDKLHKPGKCPRCHETWISPPLMEVVARR